LFGIGIGHAHELHARKAGKHARMIGSHHANAYNSHAQNFGTAPFFSLLNTQ
jgi:hypothetical protein